MELYAGIDLHSNNSVLVVLDAHDKEVYRKRLPNDLGIIIEALQQCGAIHAVAVIGIGWSMVCKKQALMCG